MESIDIDIFKGKLAVFGDKLDEKGEREERVNDFWVSGLSNHVDGWMAVPLEDAESHGEGVDSGWHAFGINPVGFEVPLKNRNGDVRLTSPRSPWFF